MPRVITSSDLEQLSCIRLNNTPRIVGDRTHVIGGLVGMDLDFKSVTKYSDFLKCVFTYDNFVIKSYIALLCIHICSY